VIGVGFPFERKGIQDFFEVARQVSRIKFIWFGALSGWLTNDKVKRWIKHRPTNAIMAGYCKGEVMHGAYQSASCLFFPSYEETEGIVVLEALASKTPSWCAISGFMTLGYQDGVNCHKGKNNEDFILS
jgi:1,2-diacylglycerol-3-alpha-glucose alpha-1,2-glucosyltransferase